MRAGGPEHAPGTQSDLDLRRHAVGRILGALDRVPEMMSDEFQEQAFRRRPGEGGAGREPAPSLEVTEVRGKRPERVFAHACAGEMFQGRDVVVGQQRGELIAAVERQDGVERVKFFGAASV
ncbi:hypothetical protein D9M68_797270 [compost metagenome]